MNPILKLIGESEEDFSEYEDLLALDAEQEKTLFNRPIPIDPNEALAEAERLGKGNVPESYEKAIAKSSSCSYRYARDVLEAPFLLGEEAISKSGWYSYVYAEFVLDARFPPGEPAIAEDAGYALDYATHVLEAPFPLGERAIAKDAYRAFEYAKFVLNDRFYAGEEAIRRSVYWPEYKKLFKIP